MQLDIETSISSNKNGTHHIRDVSLLTLIEEHSFVDALFLLWRGNLPTDQERSLLDAMLVASVEHGIAAPSIFVPRTVASTGNDMNASLAAAALTINKNHGGAIEAAAHMLQEKKNPQEIVTDRLAAKKAIPGLGHKVYKEEDPRASILRDKAHQLNIGNKQFQKLYDIADEFEKQKSKRLPVNIDGALAAGMIGLSIDSAYGMALFIIPRLVGAATHIVEETQSGGSYKRLS